MIHAKARLGLSRNASSSQALRLHPSAGHLRQAKAAVGKDQRIASVEFEARRASVEASASGRGSVAAPKPLWRVTQNGSYGVRNGILRVQLDRLQHQSARFNCCVQTGRR